MLLFLRDVIAELKKLHMPSKKEAYVTTLAIMVSIFASSLLIMVVDFLISKIVKILFGL